MEAVLAAGVRLTHISSHQHLHQWPQISKIVFDLAATHGVRAARCTRSDGWAPAKGRVRVLANRLERACRRHGLAVPRASSGLDEAALQRSRVPSTTPPPRPRRPHVIAFSCHPSVRDGRGERVAGDLGHQRRTLRHHDGHNVGVLPVGPRISVPVTAVEALSEVRRTRLRLACLLGGVAGVVLFSLIAKSTNTDVAMGENPPVLATVLLAVGFIGLVAGLFISPRIVLRRSGNSVSVEVGPRFAAELQSWQG